MVETEDTAKEILDYCISYLSNKDNLETEDFKKTKLYKEMIKEIVFFIDTN